MSRFIELELTLLNGDRLYLCDRSFEVHSQIRKNYDEETEIDGANINGYAVIESYAYVVEKIRRAKSASMSNHEHEEYLESKYEEILEMNVSDFIDSLPPEFEKDIVRLIWASIEQGDTR